MNHLLKKIWMLLIAALAGTVLVAVPGSPASALGTVNVHVEDSNGDPIEGVAVTYDDANSYLQETDSNGDTSGLLDAGPVDFEVLDLWWTVLGSGSAVVVDGGSVDITIVASPPPPFVDVEVSVLDTNGDVPEVPMIGGEYVVYVYAGNDGGDATNGVTESFVGVALDTSTGSVIVPDVPEGDHFVAVFFDGSFGSRELVAQPLTISGNPMATSLVVPVQPTGDLTVSVTDLVGTPVAGANVTVELFSSDPWPSGDTSSSSTGLGSDGTGQFTMSDISADSYRVSVSDFAGNVLGETEITVVDGTVSSGLIEIEVGAAEITLEDAGGMPITEHVTVLLASGFAGSAPDSAGLASVSGIPTGVQEFVAVDPLGNWLGTVQVTVAADPAAPAAGTIVIDPLPAFGSLDVLVEDPDGNPLEGFFVEAGEDTGMPGMGFFGLSEITGTDGLASFPSVAAGTQAFRVTGGDGFTFDGTTTITTGAATTETVIAPAQPQFGDVEVTVLDQNGQAVDNVQVQVAGDMFNSNFTFNGVATLFGVSAGSNLIEVRDPTGIVIGSATVDVVANTTTPLTINVAVPETVSVEVTVTDPSGQPIEGFTVAVQDPASPVVFDSAETGPGGVGTVQNVPEGTQTLQVFGESPFGFLVHEEPITVAGDPTQVSVVVDRLTFGDLLVTVEDPLGAPLPGANLTLSHPGPTIDLFGQFVQADANGQFLFEDLAVSTWDVVATDDFFNEIGSVSVALVDGAVTSATLVATPVPTGTAEVTITDMSGAPIEGVTVKIDGSLPTLTNATGLATIDVPEGFRGVSVFDAFDNSLGFGQMQITAGQTETLQLMVVRPEYGSLKVTATDANGQPIEGLVIDGGPPTFVCDEVSCDWVPFYAEPTGSQGMAVLDPMPIGDQSFTVRTASGVVLFEGTATIVADTQTEVTVSDLGVGSLTVRVEDAAGDPVVGVGVETTAFGSTSLAMSGPTGQADIPAVGAGSVDIEILSVGGQSLDTRTTTIVTGANTLETFVVTVPALVPPLASFGAAGNSSAVTNPETGRTTISMPVGARSDVTVTAVATCPGGVMPTTVRLLTFGPQFDMTIVGAGPSYDVTIPAGQLQNTTDITLQVECGGMFEFIDLGEIVLYDPSGFVTNERTGAPVIGAEVYLYNVPGWVPRNSAADNGTPMTCETNQSKGGADWSQPAPTGEGILEPVGSGRMSPNVNPFITDGVGHYGWDVAEGCWYVTIDVPGFLPYVSPVVGVPEEVTDLDIALTPIATVPGAPTAVVATAKKTSTSPVVEFANVSWTVPALDGNTDITGYRATAMPGGGSCVSTNTSCNISGLAPGAYTVSVVAINAVGDSAASAAASVTIADLTVPPTPAGVLPLKPARLLETRSGSDLNTVDGKFLGGGRLGAGKVVEFDVANRGGVAADASSVFLNVVAVAPDAAGYLMVFPCDARPAKDTANLNYNAGEVVGNAVVSKVSADGKVCVFSLADTDVVVDVNGFVPAGSAVEAVAPARLVDTRPASADITTVDGENLGEGRIGAGKEYEFQVTGRGGVDDNATSVFLNVVTVTPGAAGFATVYPCGGDRPEDSANVNYNGGDVVGNAVISEVGANGKVCVFTLSETDLVVDVNGYSTGTAVTGVTPARLLETRTTPNLKTVDGKFLGGGRSGAGGVVEFDVAGRGGVDADAVAVFLNVVVVTPSGPGYLMVFPCDDRPAKDAANVNYNGGDVVGNAVVSKVSADGKVCAFSLTDADIVVDVNGFVPA